MLGAFEYHLLSAVSRLDDDAYGASIQQEFAFVTRRRCSTGALYTTIHRLEKKGLVRTWMGNATAERGGRRKRMVELTAEGDREAREFYESVMKASRGVSWETRAKGAVGRTD